jgi:release factor glutamine methyltransferase
VRIASNKLADLLRYFQSELENIYSVTEIEAMFFIVTEHYLHIEKSKLNLRENINQSDLLSLYNSVKGLKTQKPLQYILGETWFYNLKFLVNEHVLIPRPETEELVDLILKENESLSSLLDIGAGSGCISITIKNNKPACETFACDISENALQLAKINAERNAVEINFFHTDILNSKKFLLAFSKKVDVIVSNPPYIKDSEKNSIHQNVLNFEPHLALFVEGNDEIIFYKKIIDICKSTLNANGKLYFELNPLTAHVVEQYAQESQIFSTIQIKKDMSGKTRFFIATKK